MDATIKKCDVKCDTNLLKGDSKNIFYDLIKYDLRNAAVKV